MKEPKPLPFAVSRLLSRVYWYVVARQRDGRETIVATYTEEADAQRKADELNAAFTNPRRPERSEGRE
jgi:hypothetical protein